ncbi:PREDICTED: synaptonemal complex central element protein 2 [Nipponia nippon]|uniref:synaptonemal complex central element protein 2 n=1 Tax=Nipponia nippon TaxID=128390 RepID=UPI000511A528|nr:PREDICTED: synaptonemal complex central element protein 2 [Nipponia nippon]
MTSLCRLTTSRSSRSGRPRRPAALKMLAVTAAKPDRGLCQPRQPPLPPPLGAGAGRAVPVALPTPARWQEPFPPLSALARQVSGLAEQLEERLFHLYGLHNELIQERLQELAEVMERVGEAEAELQQVCRTVEAAYRDLCLQPEA